MLDSNLTCLTRMILRSAAISDIGKLRKENEDRFVCDDELSLYGVADGIGGLPCGAEAAEMAITSLKSALSKSPKDQRARVLLDCVNTANRDVLTLGHRLSPIYGLGTTLTVGIILGQQLFLAHVGDSRCYLLRNNKLHKLTTDHNVENEVMQKIARGEAVEPVTENMRAALTRCIGQLDGVKADLVEIQLQPDDRFLFCTDGITRMISDSELCSIVGASTNTDYTLQRIVRLANERGGHDNETAVLLFIEE